MRVIKEPFRLFFPLGIVLGLAGVSPWLFYDLGWVKGFTKLIHGAVQIQCFLMAFAAGFLFTALPRFMGVNPPSMAEQFGCLFCLAAGAVLLLAGQMTAGYACFAALLGLILFFAARRFPKRQATPPQQFIFVPMGLLFGLAGAFLQMASWKGWLSAQANQLGWLMMSQGMFLCLIMGIGGFLAPRLMGHEVLPVLGLRGMDLGHRGPGPLPWHAAAILGLLAGFILEVKGFPRTGHVLRAAVVSSEILTHTHCYKMPPVKDRYVLFLWISLWLVMAGLWAPVALPLHRIAALHILFIGGFGLMTLSIATRVTLSHMGYGELLGRPLWAVSHFGFLFLAALGLRMLADYFHGVYFHLIAVAAFLWLGGALAWLALVLPKIVGGRPTDDEAESRVCGKGARA